MKIAILSRYQQKLERGAENFVKELSSRISKKYQVDILTDKDADSMPKVLQGKYDVVIPINGRLQSLKFSLGRVVGKYKLLITGHSGQGWDDIWNVVIARPDVFVALSESYLGWVKQWGYGIKTVKIPNGVDLTKFTPVGEKIKLKLPRPIILSAGALSWYKHHQRVIDAVSKLSIGSVLIVGEGSLKEELKKRGESSLGNRFILSNFKYQDMPKVYRSVDLFTLPSWDREAFGMVYLEAMASGLGVVAPSDLSREEIVGDAGILTDVASIQAYAQALEQALNIDWREKAINQAKKFSWDKVSKQYEKIFEGLIS